METIDKKTFESSANKFSPVRNLVFQGGSVKGIAYLGVIQGLEEAGILVKIERVAGTSAGAIIATLLAMGLNTNKLARLLRKFDFEAVLNDGQNSSINTHHKVLKTIQKRDQGIPSFFAKMSAKSVKIPLVTRVIKEFGIYEPDYIRQWIETVISKRVQKVTQGQQSGKHLTFSQLHQLVQAYPSQFKDLYMVGVNLDRQQEVTFSYDNVETQDVIIADAVQISMSIPQLFKPHHVYRLVNGKRCLDTFKEKYIDGGYFNNYPIRCFDKEKYSNPLSKNPEAHHVNDKTLGFRLVLKELKDYLNHISPAPNTIIENIAQYGKAALLGTLLKQESDHFLSREDRQRTIYINHLSISTLAFNLTEAQQSALIESGKRAWQEALQVKFSDENFMAIDSSAIEQPIENNLSFFNNI